ncbi:hypothetical protein Emin_0956 [Elusimicrobium minutum Pei191]|uniref:Uncharacterized protein n=1 Tax=Elusimicrobium minutum (strain Pei191) TaxID=445932 RepID=B2KDB3_ELUMP|nr:hypothetical protein [Elusimicrobium minutum]ACC98509.1 hypothetical protein Emin_0956 [Elusimicrobium minutum Pei191]
MKIGPFEINFKKGNKNEAIITSHSTASGTDSPKYGNSNEPLTILRGSAGVNVYERMRKGDTTIKSILSCISSPIQGATWNIRSQSEERVDMDRAALMYKYFWEEADTTFYKLLSTFLTMLPFGFAVFEKVWKMVEIDGQQIQVIDLQFRPQVTIADIDLEKRQIKQSVKGKEYFIPFEDLIFFVFDQEGEDYWGNSLLRPSYEVHKIKRNQLRNWDSAGNKANTGIFHFKVDEKSADPKSQDYKNLEAISVAVAEDKSVGMITSNKVDLNVIYPQANVAFYKETVFSMDAQMRDSVLANFLSLGSTGTGSYSVGETQYKMFMRSEQAVVNYIEEVFNKEILKAICLVNWGPMDYYPELICNNFNRDEILANLDKINQFIVNGTISTTPQDEQDIRYKLGMRELTDEEMNENIEKQKKNPPPTPPVPPSEPPAEPELEDDEEREFPPAVKNLKNAKTDEWVEGVNMYVNDLTRFMRGQLLVLSEKIVYKTRRHLETKGANGIADMLDNISYAEYQSLLKRKIGWLCSQGWFWAEEYTKANGVQSKHKQYSKDKGIPEEEWKDIPIPLRAFVSNTANVLSENQYKKLKSSVVYAVTNNANSGLSIDNIIAKVGLALDDYTEGNAIELDADMTVVQAVNTSESAYYKDSLNDGDIAYFVYVLGNAHEHTDYCLTLDGRAFTPFGTEYGMIFPPKHFGCTAHLVPVFWYPGIVMPDDIDNLSGVDLNFQQF